MGQLFNSLQFTKKKYRLNIIKDYKLDSAATVYQACGFEQSYKTAPGPRAQRIPRRRFITTEAPRDGRGRGTRPPHLQVLVSAEDVGGGDAKPAQRQREVDGGGCLPPAELPQPHRHGRACCYGPAAAVARGRRASGALKHHFRAPSPLLTESAGVSQWRPRCSARWELWFPQAAGPGESRAGGIPGLERSPRPRCCRAIRGKRCLARPVPSLKQQKRLPGLKVTTRAIQQLVCLYKLLTGYSLARSVDRKPGCRSWPTDLPRPGRWKGPSWRSWLPWAEQEGMWLHEETNCC